MRNPDEDYAYGVRRQAEIDAMDEVLWAQMIERSPPAVVRRPREIAQADSEARQYYDKMDKAVGWVLVLGAITVLAVSFWDRIQEWIL